MSPNTETRPLLKTMDDIICRAREINDGGKPFKVVVAAAHDDAVIDAVIMAHKENIATAILYGDAERIEKMITECGGHVEDFLIVHTPNDEEAANKAAMIAGRGEADIIMKGILPTPKLLRSVLKEEFGLRRKGLLSHTAILSPKRYHKLLALTDGGMVIKPTFEQKVEMIRNSVLVSRAIGVETPKVAVLSSIDHIVSSHLDTFEAAALSKMSQRGQLKHCIVDGPLSFDTAVWRRSMEVQGIESPIAGEADIVLTSTIEQGNLVAKSLINFGESGFAGVIIGARVPVSLVSRADSAENKLTSIALAVVVSHFMKTR